MSDHGSHSYFDWQVSTMMLAYDVIDPIPRHEEKRIAQRQRDVEKEIHDIAQASIPETFKQNPELEFPPAVVMLLTRATLRRASQVIGLL